MQHSVDLPLVPSLAGAACLTDALHDMPIPSGSATETEQQVMYTVPLKEETGKVLGRSDEHHAGQVAKALKGVDVGFLKLKEGVAVQEQLTVDSDLPLLVKNVIKSFQPVVKLEKVEANSYKSGLLQTAASSSTPTRYEADNLATVESVTEAVPRRLSLRSQQASCIQSVPVSQGQPTPSACILSAGQLNTPKGTLKRRSRRISSDSSDAASRHSVSSATQRPPQEGSVKSKLIVSIDLRKLQTKTHQRELTISVPKLYLKPNQSVSPVHKLPNPMITAEVPQAHPMVAEVPKSYSADIPPNKPKKKHKIQVEDIDPMRSEVYCRFLSLLEHVDMFASSVPDLHAVLQTAPEVGIPQEMCLPNNLVYQLLSDVIALKGQHLLHKVPEDRMVRLIGMLQLQVLDSKSLSINTLPNGWTSENVKGWKEIALSRIHRAIDAALLVLHIGTSPKISQRLHQDEAYERIVAMCRFHLENNIYPEFDPIYRTGKDSAYAIKAKRRSAIGPSKHIFPIYQKLTEVLSTLSLLLQTQNHTDTFVLQTSTLGIMPFFVENVNALQMAAMKLVRSIFSKYEKHRDLILEDIFASLARLPTSKKSMRTYKVSSGQTIQMVTALILQLVQCIVVDPLKEKMFQKYSNDHQKDTQLKGEQIDKEIILGFNMASLLAKNFLSTFMKKCCSGSKDEEDFRPLFDNFVQDLLATLHLPEWPAAELLLVLLGGLLTQTFGTKSNETSLRLVALEHMGTIVARLRKDALISVEDDQTIVQVISLVMESKFDTKSPSPTAIGKLDAFSENTQHLQKALIGYLTKLSKLDPSCSFAKNFCISQWMADLYSELDKTGQEGYKEANLVRDQEEAEQRKQFVRSLLKFKHSGKIEDVLTEQNALSVTRFLASFRSLSKSFEGLLKQLLVMLNDSSVHVRTKAMKSLSLVVSVDPAILSRSEVCHSIQYHMADGSALVREAAVELLGKFLLNQPELILQYYDTLIVRILDTSVSVRKRVVKIFRDICLQELDFPKRVDVFSKMLRRITDEEGVQNLIVSVFQSLWFTFPQLSGNEMDKLLENRVCDIITVMMADELVHEYFDLLLQKLIKSDKTTSKVILEACQTMVDITVKMVLTLDEKDVSEERSERFTLVGCVTLLHLFSKSYPHLLLKHAKTLQPYLSIKCTSESDITIVTYTTRILEKVLSLMTHPDGVFLRNIEDELVKLVLSKGPSVLQACVGCLDVIANKVTQDYKLVRECFQKFYSFLEKIRILHSRDRKSSQLSAHKPLLLRSVFVVSLMCKHFDFEKVSQTTPLPDLILPVKDKVYQQLMYFTDYDDDEVSLRAVDGLGYFCVRYPEFMLSDGTKSLYLSWLGVGSSVKQKLQVLRNLLFHFSEDEVRWKERQGSKKDGEAERLDALADLGDQLSLLNSQIAQAYAPSIFTCYHTHTVEVRTAVVQVVSLVLKLGLIPPAQCIPWLIAATTDPEPSVSGKSCQWVSDLDGRYGTFTQNQLLAGVKQSFSFQRQLSPGVSRGCSEDITDPQSSLAHLYTLLRGSKQKRRPFLRAAVNQFTDTDKNELGLMLYIADNLAYFPYNTIEEPLFVLHEMDMALSVHCAAVQQKFRETLCISNSDDDQDNLEALSHVSLNVDQLNSCCNSSQSCFLLLNLSQHLKLSYNLNDSKCSKYNPNESTKMFDKNTVRKCGILFNPNTVLEQLRYETSGRHLARSKEDCLSVYLQFKKLMNSMDPFEDKNSPEPMDSAKPTNPPVVQYSTGEGKDQASSDTTDLGSVASAAVGLLKKRGRPRLSSSGSSVSSRGVRSRRNSDGSDKSGTRKKRRPSMTNPSDSEDEDPDYKFI